MIGIPLGVLLGLGLWTLVGALPWFGAPRLARRIAPYIRDVSPDARELARRAAADPGAVLVGMLGPWGAHFMRRGDGADPMALRLRRAGLMLSVPAFRARQVVAALVGFAVGVASGVLAAHAAPTGWPVLLVAPIVGCALGAVLPEQLLAYRAARRRTRMASELPTVLELLTLALSAGEGIHDAVRRVAAAGSGELCRELGRAVAETASGVPLGEALARSSHAAGLPAYTRAIDQIVAALDRGAPLSEVLRAQAADVRADAKRALIEAAGKSEVTMLLPLVFGELPITVAFALWPGLLVLQLGF